MEVNRTTMIAVIVVAILLFGGIGYAWINSKTQPDANYQPVTMPSQNTSQPGYPGTSSSYPGSSGYPSGSSQSGYPGTDDKQASPPGPAGAGDKKPAESGQ